MGDAGEDDEGALRGALCAGQLADARFDCLLTGNVASRSSFYWTPLAVAFRAAEIFASHGTRRVLDVGSGAGKFCLAAAASQSALEVVGLERRQELVEVARALATRLQINNAQFVPGEALEISWDDFDGVYFFNPFAENISPDEEKFDLTQELSLGRLLEEMQQVGAVLRGLRPGTMVVSYHGIGAPVPSSYELVTQEFAGTGRLRAWLRTRLTEEPWCYLETDEGVHRATHAQLEDATRKWQVRYREWQARR